ncbi:MAG: ABC transporter ATP-binding protein [Anaerolineales bacterium]|uniref:ABC transporter ATP-binding protein n=1 Tax=Candidatus Villigracilis proximus TaxID=3140683 RepID=UPI0031355421|nr:ABC transporter ATP-binding protein [Anaerolineales bacterium]
MKNIIEINDLLIQRNGRDALKIASLEIQRGETLAIVGPNGAGKSTLLLALARLIKPARGQMIFNGSPISQMNDLEYRRRISFVFQDPLLMDMTVEKNIALGLKFRGTDKEETRIRVDRWSKAMGVESLLGRRAGQLSGGEAQRVSLARAFVLDPELLLMDEPFSAVDPPTRAQLLNDLSTLLSQEDRTTIFVTHNLKEAAQVGSRVAVIINGELKQVGTPMQIKGNPVDLSLKGFLREF